MRYSEFIKNRVLDSDEIGDLASSCPMPTEIKCNSCKHKKGYATGSDEYPARTYLEYCAKGHWEGGPEPEPDKSEVWDDCIDFMPHETEKPVSKPLEPEQKKLASGGNKGFEVVGDSSPKIDRCEFECAMQWQLDRIANISKGITPDDVTDIRTAHNTDMQALQALRDQLKQSTELIETQRTRIKELSIRIAQRDGLVQSGRAI